MIIGVGTDLVSIDRIASVMVRHGDRFIHRCFAVEEQWISARSAPNIPSPSQGEGRVGDRSALSAIAAHYAKRWAAKEAVAKALGLGIDAGVYLRDIMVIKDPRGAPGVELRGGAARLLVKRGGGEGAQVHLSLSDDAGFALAFVVIEA